MCIASENILYCLSPGNTDVCIKEEDDFLTNDIDCSSAVIRHRYVSQ
jgi:hypothetical protein